MKLRTAMVRRFFGIPIRILVQIWASKANHIERRAVDYRNAICIHGPVSSQNAVDAIAVMRARFPDKYICLATWIDEPSDYIDKIRELVDDIVFAQEPDISWRHANYQLVLAQKALKRVKEVQEQNEVHDGCVLRVRSDACFFKRKIFEEYRKISLVESDNLLFNLRGRLLVAGLSKYDMYRHVDFFMLGYTEDMLHYWGQPLAEKERVGERPLKLITAAKSQYAPECFFLTNFLKNEGYYMKYTYEDSWYVYRGMFYTWSWFKFGCAWLKYPDFYIDHTWIFKSLCPRLERQIISEKELIKSMATMKAKYDKRIDPAKVNATDKIWRLRETWN